MMNMKSKLTLISSSFEPDGPIAKKYTCDGEDISPESPGKGRRKGPRLTL